MTATNMMEYYIGVDVGTGSARACLVDRLGSVKASYSAAIETFRSSTDHRTFEQSTDDIWQAVCVCSRAVLSASQVLPEHVKGIGFDATCSLAVLNGEGIPLSVSRTSLNGHHEMESDANLGLGGARWNVILWADHRAEEEANIINRSDPETLREVGGPISLEMQLPKILWLKRHMPPGRFEQCKFFDLPDFLTYRATSDIARSTCSLGCKFTYAPPGIKVRPPGETNRKEPYHEGWSTKFFDNIGLHSMVEDSFAAIGGIPGENGLVLYAGQPVGSGLSSSAAEQLGLLANTAVGSGVIDAYAGWIGTVAATSVESSGRVGDMPVLAESFSRLAAVAGTSTCHIVQSPRKIAVPGVWGPYQDAVFPAIWMSEGGQSSTGQLIDFMMTTHPAYPELMALATRTGKDAFDLLAETLQSLCVERAMPTVVHLTKDMHLYPDLHGNRSPLADPQMKGMMTGLTLDSSLGNLAMLFNVTLEAIALQTRHIVDAMNSAGHEISAVFMSGSQANNTHLMSLLATVLDMPVFIPPKPSLAVVLGAAVLGRHAHESVMMQKTGLTYQAAAEAMKMSKGGDLWRIMSEMTAPALIIQPAQGTAGATEAKLLEAKYQIFKESIEVQRRWRAMMSDS